MNIRTVTRAHRALVVAALAAIAPLTAGAATLPTITFDLRVHGTGGKQATVTHAGDIVVMDLYAIAGGLDLDPTNDRVTRGIGAFLSSNGGLLGDLLGLVPPAPFDALPVASMIGGQRDADGDGDLDVAGVGTAATGYYAFRVPPPGPAQPTAGGFWVGQVQFTATSVTDGASEVNYLNNADNLALTANFDGGLPVTNNPTKVTVTSASPVVIQGTPANVQRLSGTIDTHLTVAGTMLPTSGSTVTLTRGADLPAGTTLDLREPAGGFGASELRVNDQVSGNAGGTLVTGSLAIGTSDPGRFAQTAGSTSALSAIVGNGAAGQMDLAGGSFSAISKLTIGGSTPGEFVQTSGLLSATAIDVGTSAAAAGSRWETAGGKLNVQTLVRVGVDGGEGVWRHAGSATTTNLADRMIIGAGGGSGMLELAGGNILAAYADIGVGAGGHGEVVQTDGLLHVAGASPRGIVNLTPGTPHTGPGPAPVGRYTQRGGTFSALTLNVGMGGDGTYVLEGGVASPTYAYVRNASGGVARLEVHGGVWDSETLAIGGVAPARGELLQTGGDILVRDLGLPSGSTYRMSGGTLHLKGNNTIGGTFDLASSAARVQADSWLTFAPGSLVNAEHATFVGGPRSLFRFPTGFDPFTEIGSIETAGGIQVDGQPLFVPPQKSIGGTGTIAGSVNNSGTVSPGNSPGALTITDDYTQFGDGTLEVEIGGINAGTFDTLTVGDATVLDGFLNVSLVNGFVPSASYNFKVLSAKSLTGRFDNVTPAGHVEFPGGRFNVLYLPTGVTLTNFSTLPEPGAVAPLLVAGAAMMRRRRRRG